MPFFKTLFTSFQNALCGFCCAVKRERNLRIHIVAVFYITLFGIFYGLEKLEWAVIILVMGGVLSAELMNTAIEENTDLKSSKINLHAKNAKDTAAAAVFVQALASVAVALFVFSDWGKIVLAFQTLFSPPYLLLVLLSAVAAIFFVLGFQKYRKKI